MEWTKFFAQVPDFRIDRCKRHRLSDILMISVCAVVSGAEDFEEIAEYGRQKQSFLKQFLELPNGIPSHDTFNRVFCHLDQQAFGQCLWQWSAELVEQLQRPQVSLDGKVLRATAKAGHKKSGICLISAWVDSHRLVLGQRQVAGKSNEKTAIPELIESLELTGALVSIDAVACSTTIAGQLQAKGADYLLALKANHKGLYEQVRDYLQPRLAQLPTYQQWDKNGSRIEHRQVWVCEQLSLLDDLAQWPGIRSVVWLASEREVNGQKQQESRLYLSSAALDAAGFLKAIRGHWGIENRLHWQLDVTFREDQSRLRKGEAAANMATLRKLALQLLQRMSDRESLKSRRKMAAWNDDYLLQVLHNLTL